MSARQRQFSPQDYTVGWLCALPLTEQLAALVMLDEEHQAPTTKSANDHNAYIYGSIGSHNIVITCMPLGQPGTTSASRMVGSIPNTFPNLRFYLFVGVGGGIPRNPPHSNQAQDIHLGDVVVGLDDTAGVAGVVQYDLIRDYGPKKRDLLGIFDKPHPELLNNLSLLFTRIKAGKSDPIRHLGKLADLEPNFSEHPPGGDRLYQSSCKHKNGAANCDQCPTDQLVDRSERPNPKVPIFHRGQILSGNSVIKDSDRRDELSREYPHARCFEMEAAGVVDQTHCLVIRGIADYADSHKNGTWQPYAAGTAAAFARELLLTVQPSNIQQIGPVNST